MNLMRTLITLRFQKDFFTYDNLLHRGELAGHLGILAVNRGCDITHPDEAQSVPSAMAWLLIIYILPLVGIIAYLSFGELHLGKRRAERARAMWPPPRSG